MEHRQPSDTFRHDLEIVPVATIEFIANREVLDDIQSSLDTTGILLLGEIHGVRENPSVIKTVMNTFGIKRLALEWDKTLGDTAAHYVETGIVAPDSLVNRDDGRFTSGHLALIRDLMHENLLDGLICIDRYEAAANWQGRDQIMANEVINHAGEPLLVVAGNLHTRIRELYLDDEFPNFQPMGSIIKKEFPAVATIKINYGSGTYMNMGIQSFNDDQSSSTSNFTKTGQDEFSFYIPTAHAAIVPLR